MTNKTTTTKANKKRMNPPIEGNIIAETIPNINGNMDIYYHISNFVSTHVFHSLSTLNTHNYANI